MRRFNAGFTLIELMVAVSIAAILARISFDVYSSYITRANRAVARAALLNLTQKEEQQLNLTGAYVSSSVGFTPLNGLPSVTTSYFIDQNGAPSTSLTGNSIYQIQFTSTTASTTTYSFKATAQGVQLKRDASCASLIIDNTGLKQAITSGGAALSGSALTTCWEK
jgi:type IV pilus assembly protein PilE